MVASFGEKTHLWWLLSMVIILTGSLDVVDTDSDDEYRHRKCVSYRTLTFNGLRVEWIPFQNAVDPCSLRCRDPTLGLEVLLEARVPDGTGCRNQTVDGLCVNGTCMSMGCDGRLGSGIVRDRCGICGGDGSTCGSEKGDDLDLDLGFRWHLNYSACSASCGIGFQTTEVKCIDERSLTTVGDERCDVTAKPEVQTKICRTKCRRYVWISGEWSQCSRSCGGSGLRQRTVFCALELPDGSFDRKSNALCTGNRPEMTAVCQEGDCPQWIAGQWSPCSATCSVGIQTRPVVCRGTPGVDCPETEKPVFERPCHTGMSCRDHAIQDRDDDYEHGEHQGRGDYEQVDLELAVPDASSSEEHDSELEGGGGISRDKDHHTIRGRKMKPRGKDFPTQKPSEQVSGGQERRRGRMEFERPSFGRMEQGGLMGSGDSDRVAEGVEDQVELRSSPIGNNREVSTTPSFVVSSWGQCSATCGNGIRTRRVQCQVYQETNRSIADLPDTSCSGPRPQDTEYCHLSDCYDEAVSENYAWSLSGYGLCSRSCAGGTQETTFSCLRISDFTMTKNDKCQHLPLPRKPPRPCNEHRCPPRWRAFPNGLCSASCGGGQQMRSIRCIYDLDSGDVEEIPDDRCPPPKPPNLIVCNMAPCPPVWNVDSWSECSVTCGQGIQFRQVRCEQKVSLSTVATVNESLCAGQSPPPQGNQTCQSSKVCPVRAKQSVIRVDAKSFSQLSPINKVPLLVGGTAAFIPGTTIQVTCLVRHFNRSLITWYRGDHELGPTGRVKVTPKGLLRIRNSRPSDAGVYACRAGRDSASINITFITELEAQKLEEAKSAFVRPYRRETGVEERQSDEKQRPISIKYLLEKFALKDLPLQFYPHPWSACSKTCGGSGLQSRDITCEVTMERGYTLVVNDSFCHNKGLIKPIETRDCGYESSALTCPSWDAGPWQECSDELCIRTGIGSKTRSTYCLAHNGSKLASSYCSTDSQPDEEEECEHENCTALWSTSDWTKCSISCGGKGVKSRTVDCIWGKSGKSAPDECQEETRPESTKPCFMPLCPEPSVCRDESKYCILIPKLHMCRYPQYRHECCFSCSLHASFSGHQQVAPQSLALRSRHHHVV